MSTPHGLLSVEPFGAAPRGTAEAVWQRLSAAHKAAPYGAAGKGAIRKKMSFSAMAYLHQQGAAANIALPEIGRRYVNHIARIYRRVGYYPAGVTAIAAYAAYHATKQQLGMAEHVDSAPLLAAAQVARATDCYGRGHTP